MTEKHGPSQATPNFHFCWHIINHERNVSEFSAGNLGARREQTSESAQFDRSERSTEEFQGWGNGKSVNNQLWDLLNPSRVTRTTDKSCRPQSPMEKQTDFVTAEADWRLKSHAGTRTRAKRIDILNQSRLIHRLMTMIPHGQTWGTKCHSLSRCAHRP